MPNIDELAQVALGKIPSAKKAVQTKGTKASANSSSNSASKTPLVRKETEKTNANSRQQPMVEKEKIVAKKNKKVAKKNDAEAVNSVTTTVTTPSSVSASVKKSNESNKTAEKKTRMMPSSASQYSDPNKKKDHFRSILRVTGPGFLSSPAVPYKFSKTKSNKKKKDVKTANENSDNNQSSTNTTSSEVSTPGVAATTPAKTTNSNGSAPTSLTTGKKKKKIVEATVVRAKSIHKKRKYNQTQPASHGSLTLQSDILELFKKVSDLPEQEQTNVLQFLQSTLKFHFEDKYLTSLGSDLLQELGVDEEVETFFTNKYKGIGKEQKTQAKGPKKFTKNTKLPECRFESGKHIQVKSGTRRKCFYCQWRNYNLPDDSTKKLKRTCLQWTEYQCSKCGIALCPPHKRACFETFHFCDGDSTKRKGVLPRTSEVRFRRSDIIGRRRALQGMPAPIILGSPTSSSSSSSETATKSNGTPSDSNATPTGASSALSSLINSVLAATGVSSGASSSGGSSENPAQRKATDNGSDKIFYDVPEERLDELL
eukprot:g1441.t1